MNSSRDNPQGYQVYARSLRPTPVLRYVLIVAGGLLVVVSVALFVIMQTPTFKRIHAEAEAKARLERAAEAIAAPTSEQADRLAALENIQASTRGNQPKGEISSMATDPYTRNQYPTTVAKFGKAISAVNADRRKASEIAIKDPRCNGVSNAQVSSNSPKVNRRYWVECGNLTRFRFDQASIAKGEPVSVQTIQDMGRDGLITD